MSRVLDVRDLTVALRRSHRARPARRSPSATARSSPSSGRRAAARARCCASSPACSPADAGRGRASTASTSPRPDAPARRRHGVPGRAAVPPPRRRRQRRVRAADARRRPRRPADRRVAELLALVGLAGFEHRPVTDLSGGEAKRVALARSLAPSPRPLLLDEPLTGLDRELHDRLAVDLAGSCGDAATTACSSPTTAPRPTAVADRVVTIDRARCAPSVDAVVELTTPDDPRPPPRACCATARRRPTSTFDGDDDPTTIHLGLVDGTGAVVAVSTWLGGRAPTAPDRARRPAARHGRRPRPPRRRARGRPARRRRRAGLRRAAPSVVWANARDTALDFYAATASTSSATASSTPPPPLPHHRIPPADRLADRLLPPDFPFRDLHDTQGGSRHSVPRLGRTAGRGGNPMASDPQAAEYRRRAGALRAAGRRLDDAPLHDAAPLGGPDTWTSPTRRRAACPARRDRRGSPTPPTTCATRPGASTAGPMSSTPRRPRARSVDVGRALLRYDPDRIRDLDRRTAGAAAALAELAALAGADPAAADAMRVLRQRARRTSSCDWLPLLRRLSRSDAMLTPVDGRPGRARRCGAARPRPSIRSSPPRRRRDLGASR